MTTRRYLAIASGVVIGATLLLMCILGSLNVLRPFGPTLTVLNTAKATGEGGAALFLPDVTPLHYVSTNGTDGGDCNTPDSACLTLQYAIDQADAGDEILVASGTYTGVSARPWNDVTTTGVVTQVAYISKTLTIRGGYTAAFTEPPDSEANRTTLDAEGKGRALYITGDVSPTIEGLCITGGDASELDGTPGGDAGGGVYIITATATINNNEVRDNNTSGNGGGLFIAYSATTVSNNVISKNRTDARGGGLSLYSSNALLRDNTILSNTSNSRGGGLSLHLSNAVLKDNSIFENTSVSRGGGGLSLNRSDATLDSNLIISNTADVHGGGLHLVYSDPRLSNNIISNNSALDGTALCILKSSPCLVHNTIAQSGGVAQRNGSGIYVVGNSNVVMTNTILANHTVGIYVRSGNTALLESTLWDGNTTDWSGGGTINRNHDYTGSPAFIDPVAGDYHISLASAAIDRGVDAGINGDMDGESRPQSKGYDIGADETGLVVSKQVGPEVVYAGEQLTYTIQVTNTSNVTLTTTITDVLPTHIISSGIFTWPSVGIASGGIWTETVVVTVEMGYTGSITNVVQVSTEDGIIDADTCSVTVNEAITGLSAINDSPTSLGHHTTLTATVATGNEVAYTWAFGDDNIGSGAIATHIYSDVGVYTAVVTAANNVNVATDTTTVTITNAPITELAAIDDGPTPLGQATTLTAIVATGGDISYMWNFGDGEVGEGAVVSHTYPAVGTYTAVVTASNSMNVVTTSTTVSVIDIVHLPLVAKRWPPVPYTPVLNPIDNPDEDGYYTVAWEEADLADSYILEEATNASFSGAQVVYRGTELSWSVPNPGKSSGVYYYRVKARNSWGDSSWSDGRQVTVNIPPTPTPTTQPCEVIAVETTRSGSYTTIRWYVTGTPAKQSFRQAYLCPDYREVEFETSKLPVGYTTERYYDEQPVWCELGGAKIGKTTCYP
jgi:uncharacterized repeat protein (TIGR01451 family)